MGDGGRRLVVALAYGTALVDREYLNSYGLGRERIIGPAKGKRQTGAWLGWLV